MKIINIVGNIGSGKTTFIKYLEKKLKNSNYSYIIAEEPVEKWIKSGQLSLFYTNMKDNAVSFQIYVIYTKYKRIEVQQF